MTVAQIVAAFRNIVGWPYVTPGSNDSRGIDCSGAFVYAYRLYGYSIYHGSNRIIRKYCHDVFEVSSVSQLRVGMAIFKSRTSLDRLSSDYKPGGRYYDPSLPYDYYHVGLVTSVSPLQIINATPPKARVDTTLKGWCCAGYLNEVNYSGDTPGPDPDPGPGPNPDPGPVDPVIAYVYAPTGKTVNLRSKPSTGSVVLVRVPIGETVTVLDYTNEEWAQVRYQKTTGYMMREFLRSDPPES